MKDENMGAVDDFDRMYCGMNLFTSHEWGEFPSSKEVATEMKKLYDLKTVRSLLRILKPMCF